DVVGPRRAVDDDGVCGAVADPAGGIQVDVDRPRAGTREIVDGRRVGTAERAEVDRLDVVQVHGDRGDVAGQARAGAVRADLDVLADVGAVEVELIHSELAFDGVAA